MVAMIHTGYSIRSTLAYNENKVLKGTAECIGAGNYPIELGKLSPEFKLNRFLGRLELNRNVHRNCLHISINFDPSEQALSAEVLVRIAESYMQKVGFGEQPFLIYQHHDAGHPHVHVVSINVAKDGRRLEMSVKQCHRASRAIEAEFNLRPIGAKKQGQLHQENALPMQQLTYGEYELKKSIATILAGILETYTYTNMDELNAILLQYRVLADPGSKDSRIFKHAGLVYRTVNEHGKTVGSYIKASSFDGKPTLKYLDKQFKKNEAKHQFKGSRLEYCISMLLLNQSIPFDRLLKQLESQGIHASCLKEQDGSIRSIIYVDHQDKIVFDEPSVDAVYRAKALQERCKKHVISVQFQQSYPGGDQDVETEKYPQNRQFSQVAEQESREYTVLNQALEPPMLAQKKAARIRKPQRMHL